MLPDFIVDRNEREKLHYETTDDDVHFEDLLFEGAKDYKDYARIRDKYYEGRK